MKKLTIATLLLSSLLLAISSGFALGFTRVKTGDDDEKMAAPCFHVSTQDVWDKAVKEAGPTVNLPNADGNRISTMSKRFDPSANNMGFSIRFAAKNADMRPGILVKCTIHMATDGKPALVKYYESTGALDGLAPDGTKKDGTYLYFGHDADDIKSLDVEILGQAKNGKRTKWVGGASWEMH